MNYMENVNDPLKYYFKQKIGNIYVNKEIINLLWKKKNSKTRNLQLVLERKKPEKIEKMDKRNVNTLIDRYKKKVKFWKRIKEPVYNKNQIERKVVKKRRGIDVVSIINKFYQNDKVHNRNIRDQLSYINTRLYTRRDKALHKSYLKRNYKIKKEGN